MPQLRAYEVTVLPPTEDEKISSRVVLWLCSADTEPVQ
jgi:hypothetical protein